ncbi:zf-CCHC domain-containing protein/gag_pre-integrs domain-containing protein [Cinnamomum micranthum f. kanehirae]|uniref:Zf-CCHC domain-containing protein/gag_pre-integrs domain-containing protein n=1 Tax=Cinnamomum micranthum f. kanehirae TaxID=337451 RepID=A0A3S3MH19_9MAGN|nr:zf-CCHC domain-containing protein/gag_pre-integrs domain-containing protein [Cinnamomum micranthum f. kanehirae]
MSRLPSPSLDECFNELLREEQRQLTQFDVLQQATRGAIDVAYSVRTQSQQPNSPVNVAYATKGKQPSTDISKVQCYKCQNFGHYANQCKQRIYNYCKASRHSINECHKRPQNRNSKVYQAIIVTSGTIDSSSISSSAPASAAPITPDMIQQTILQAFSTLGISGSGDGEGDSEVSYPDSSPEITFSKVPSFDDECLPSPLRFHPDKVYVRRQGTNATTLPFLQEPPPDPPPTPDPPQLAICRSSRISRPSDRYGFSHSSYLATLSFVSIPTSYSQVAKQECWRKAMKEELNALQLPLACLLPAPAEPAGAGLDSQWSGPINVMVLEPYNLAPFSWKYKMNDPTEHSSRQPSSGNPATTRTWHNLESTLYFHNHSTPEIPDYIDSTLNPIYMIHLSDRSSIFINHPDWHIENLKELCLKPYSEILVPNATVILQVAKERRRNLVLEDILHSHQRRFDLDKIFLKHRKPLLQLMTRMKAIKKCISKMNGVSQTAELYREDYNACYNEFMGQLPEYQAAFQEAVMYADQLDLIPNSAKPYVST